MKRVLLPLLAMALLLGGCRPAAAPRSPDLATQLQALVDSGYARSPNIPGLMVRVEAPSLGLAWAGAAGFANRATKEKLDPSLTVRIASNTKTYIAATTLRLVEDGKVELDKPIQSYLAPQSIKELKRGGYDPAAITVRMLLHHTSGIFDYAMAPEFQNAILGNFGHRWTRAEQLSFAVDHGKPIGKPDEKYSYSDTGYILLGEIIERVSGLTMWAAVRELLAFDRHGIKATYFETLDSVPPGTPPRARQYLDTLDTETLDASHDLYGGGGIVSNLENLARFYRALVRGELFSKPETLAMMLEPTAQSKVDGGGGYGMGIGRREVDGVTCYGHSGFWGTSVRHCPSIDVTIAAGINRSPDETSAPAQAVLGEMIKLVHGAITGQAK